MKEILRHFGIEVDQSAIHPLGDGLINDTFRVDGTGRYGHDFVLQRINHNIFKDVDVLQHNIDVVTGHIRAKLVEQGVDNPDDCSLRFLADKETGKTYTLHNGNYWRVMIYLRDTYTRNAVNEENAAVTGRAFGQFQSMLADIAEPLQESIPNFHNMEFRLGQFRDAIDADSAGRKAEVMPLIEELLSRADSMCLPERMHAAGKLPKRICHCDTKVNNILFDAEGNVVCVIDLDTVMPSFVSSDFGDFLRTAGNTGAEDDPCPERVEFNLDIFRAFARGYMESARGFLTPAEIESLSQAPARFAYMQAVRFLTDYLSGDTYYKIDYPDHNLVRTRAQFKLLTSIEAHQQEMARYIAGL